MKADPLVATDVHQRVATVCTSSPDEAVRAVADADADLIEVRLDALWPTPPEPEPAADLLERLLSAAAVPLVATLRPVRQAGHFEGPEEVRLGLLEAAARSGFATIDVENDLAAAAPLLHHLSKATRSIILSNHLDAVPDRDLGSRHLTAMQDLGAKLQKLAFTCPGLPGALRALELVRLHASRGGRPALAPVGARPHLRALLALVGNHATYGAASAKTAAPGQPPLADIDAVWSHWGIGSEELGVVRDWFAVLGQPVTHSLSPRMHNASLQAHGDQRRMGALEVDAAPGMLHLLVSVAPRIGLAGASVTAPLKQALLSVAEPDDVARGVGAANCLWFDDGRPHCTNTDATAFRRLLDGDVLVLGAGGAARAACWAAAEEGLSFSVAARDPDAAKHLADTFGGGVVAWSDRHGHRGTVAQCTTADVWEAPAPRRAIELVYASPTRLSQATQDDAGDGHVSGRRFLLEQARDAYRVWTGRGPDEAMAASLGL